MLAGPAEDPVHVFDDLVVLLAREVPGLVEFLVTDEKRLPGVLVPGLDPIQDGAVFFFGPTAEDTVPFFLIPELPGLFLVAVVGVPVRIAERFGADAKFEDAVAPSPV